MQASSGSEQGGGEMGRSCKDRPSNNIWEERTDRGKRGEGEIYKPRERGWEAPEAFVTRGVEVGETHVKK